MRGELLDEATHHLASVGSPSQVEEEALAFKENLVYVSQLTHLWRNIPK
jgi:hypothetical protein